MKTNATLHTCSHAGVIARTYSLRRARVHRGWPRARTTIDVLSGLGLRVCARVRVHVRGCVRSFMQALPEKGSIA